MCLVADYRKEQETAMEKIIRGRTEEQRRTIFYLLKWTEEDTFNVSTALFREDQYFFFIQLFAGWLLVNIAW